MKRMLKAAALTCLLLCALCSAALAQFDLSEFEFEGEYKDMYSVSHENDNVFIDADLSAKEKSFSHEHESKEYYSTLEADLIVLYPGRVRSMSCPGCGSAAVRMESPLASGRLNSRSEILRIRTSLRTSVQHIRVMGRPRKSC